MALGSLISTRPSPSYDPQTTPSNSNLALLRYPAVTITKLLNPPIRANAYPPKWAHVIGAFFGRSLTTFAPLRKPHLHSCSKPRDKSRWYWQRAVASESYHRPPAFLFTILWTPFTYMRIAHKAC